VIIKNNSNSFELQSNSKRARIEIDLVNLPRDPCLRKKKIMTTIRVIEIKFEEHMYKKDLVNLIMIFQKDNWEKHGVVLVQHVL